MFGEDGNDLTRNTDVDSVPMTSALSALADAPVCFSTASTERPIGCWPLFAPAHTEKKGEQAAFGDRGRYKLPYRSKTT